MKRSLRYVKLTSIVLVLLLSFTFICGGSASALPTIDTYPFIGLGDPLHWNGGAMIECSEIMDFLKVRSKGIEFCMWGTTDWDLTNEQFNVWIVGISGSGTYTAWGCPLFSLLISEGFFWFPEIGYENEEVVLPHPGIS